MGELYTAQRGGKNVLRFAFDGSGNVTGSDIPIAGLGGDGARGVQVNPANGDVFVSLCCGRNPSINRYELDASGNATLAQQFFAPGDPHDMVFSPWGELFTANINGGSVSRFTIDALGNAVPNGQITGFGEPTGLDFSPWGELFVSNRATGVVFRFTFDASDPVNNPPTASGSFTVSPLTPGSLAEIQFGSGGDPASSLVAKWPGEGDATDVVGGNNGTLLNGVTFAPGVVGQAFSLDGVDDAVVIPHRANLNLGGAFTIDFWVKAHPQQPESLFNIVDKSHSFGGINGWTFQALRSTGRVPFTVGTGSIWTGVGHTPNVLDDQWHHIATVFTGSELRLYWDGGLTAVAAFAGPIAPSPGDLQIGRWWSGPSRHFRGLVDELEIYNIALTDDEIALLASGAPANSPPEVATDTDPVEVDEGQTANNTGTVGDPDGDAVSLAASVGTVTNNSDGTWSWSFLTSDGPSESQTVTIDANDGNGGTAQTSFTLTVNNVVPTVTSVSVPGAPVAIGDQPVSGSGTFSDPGGTVETYTCSVDYGDGSGPQGGTVSSGTTCTGPAQTYAEAGIYTVTVTVTDSDGGTGSLPAETFLVIYDSSGGFVTGGGWISSPAGAYVPDPSLVGKANFGFVSKYKKGATVPTGNTQFQFKAGDLNFHSSSYEFLVVTQGGARAQFKGSGRINGELAPTGEEFRFMIWANDGSPDTFRIRIWYEDGAEVLVYDNDFDQPIGGGSIVIHTK